MGEPTERRRCIRLPASDSALTRWHLREKLGPEATEPYEEATEKLIAAGCIPHSITFDGVMLHGKLKLKDGSQYSGPVYQWTGLVPDNS